MAPAHHTALTHRAYREAHERVMHNLDDATTRIEMEYREMPDLKLTFWQARRLWNLEDDVCEAALARLVAAKVLSRTSDGRYIRRGFGSIPLAS